MCKKLSGHEAPVGPPQITMTSLSLSGSQVMEAKSLAAVVRTEIPAVGLMEKCPDGNLAFPIRVPVIRDNAVRYGLTAVIRPEPIADMLARQSIPGGWTVSIFDRRKFSGGALTHERAISGGPLASHCCRCSAWYRIERHM